jgi:hypothetical protein
LRLRSAECRNPGRVPRESFLNAESCELSLHHLRLVCVGGDMESARILV